jgi:hypothetical protein
MTPLCSNGLRVRMSVNGLHLGDRVGGQIDRRMCFARLPKSLAFPDIPRMNLKERKAVLERGELLKELFLSELRCTALPP